MKLYEFDQTLYSKAWMHEERYKQVVPWMGAFHTLRKLISIIGKIILMYHSFLSTFDMS